MSHYELVRTDAGWHSRLVGSNGKTVMSSEVYATKRAARCSVAVAFDAAGVSMNRPPTVDVPGRIVGQPRLYDEPTSFPLPEVDER